MSEIEKIMEPKELEKLRKYVAELEEELTNAHKVLKEAKETIADYESRDPYLN